MLLLEQISHSVDISGIDESCFESVPIGTAAGLIKTTKGPIIGLFHQYSLHGKDSTIHSANQLRSFGLDVNDVPKSLVGGRQSIVTLDGYIIPLAIRDSL